MRVPFHLDGVFKNGFEAKAAMPASICEYAFGTLGMAVVAVVAPHLGAGAPAIEADGPFEADTDVVRSPLHDIENGIIIPVEEVT